MTLEFCKTLPASLQIEHLEPPEVGTYHTEVYVNCTDSSVRLCFGLQHNSHKGKTSSKKHLRHAKVYWKKKCWDSTW